MPGVLLWATYFTDDSVAYAKQTDTRAFGDPNRAWSSVLDPLTLPLFPLGARPRRVYGTSPTTGRRAHCVVATVTAPLWDKLSGVNTFTVSDPSQPTGEDTLQVTSRVGEKWPRPHGPGL